MNDNKMRFIVALITLLTLKIFCQNPCLAEELTEAHVPQFIYSYPRMITLSLEASPFTGESFTSFPIKLPPSAGNIEDEVRLELQYRSGGSNSWLGKGWDLDLGYIARINKFGIDSPNNPYVLVLNNQSYELVCIGGNQYRTKIETNRKIEFNGSAWYVWDKNGAQYRFENSIGARWVLTKVTNTHGISMALEYDIPNNEEIYLKEIRYPEGPELTPYCKINFVSEDRQDRLITYYYNNILRINRRLKEIQIKADDQIQKKYILSYTDNGTTKVSLLNSITEQGKDGQSLPPVTFSYQQPLRDGILGTKKEWSAEADTYTYESLFEAIIGSVPAGMNMAIIDLNGDNLPDLIGCQLKDTYPVRKYDWLVRLNTGSGFSEKTYKWLDANNSYTSSNYLASVYESLALTRNTTLIDMNNDGLPDLVYNKLSGWVPFGFTYVVTYDIAVRYNTGDGFSDTETKLLDYTKSYYIDGNVLYKLLIGSTAALADLNGDNLPDLIYHRQRGFVSSGFSSYSVHDWTVRLNTGTGFSDEEKIWLSYDKAYLKYELSGADGSWAGYRFERINMLENAMFVDMNNDGLLDLVFNDFASAQSIRDPSMVAPAYNIKVRYNTGRKFSDDAVTYYSNAPVYFYKDNDASKVSSVKIGENGIPLDINNDGLPDFIFNQYQTDSSGNPKVLWMVCFNLGNTFSSPLKLLDSQGYFLNNEYTYAYPVTYNSFLLDINKDGTVDVIYPQFTEWSGGIAKFKLIAFLSQGSISSDLLVRQTSSFGGITSLSYAPSGNFKNYNLRFIMPVTQSIITNSGVDTVGTTTYNYEDGWYDLANREFRGFRHVKITDPLGFVSDNYFYQDDSRLGKIEREMKGPQSLTYEYWLDSTSPYFTGLKQKDDCLNATCSRLYYEYDNYGNPTKEVSYGDTSVAGDEKTILTDYAVNSSLWLVDLTSRQRIFPNSDASGAAASETQHLYDNNPNYTDTPTKGDLTKVRRYLDTKNIFIETSSTYDTYGNEVTKTDARSKTITIEYEPTYHSFPETITNPKGHSEKLAYYLPSDTKGLFGQLKSKTDPNNNETLFEYDTFGRKTKVIGPLDTGSTYGSESYEYAIGGPGANYILTRTTEEYGTGNHFIKVDIFDGFERVIQSLKESEAQDTYSYITTGYDTRGQISKVSLPYFTAGGLKTSYQAPDSSVKWIQYAYDAIARPTTVTNPDSTFLSNSYNGWEVTVTDENTHAKVFTKDAYGRLSLVKENNGLESYTTNYKYDCLDNLRFIYDHFNNKFEFIYDTLGRRTKTIDPDLGAWDYDYDNNANLIKLTNGNRKVINFTYDELNRMLTKEYFGQGIAASYHYDETSSLNGIVRRTSMDDLSGRSRWDYDQEGRVTRLEKTIDDVTYKTEWSYDAMDRIDYIILPNFKKIDFNYNNAGLTESIEGFVLNTDYNAALQPTSIIYSNPILTRLDYYPQNQRLRSISTGSLQDLRYEYDNVGNINKITDGIRSNVKDYIYDDLDRLTLGDGNSYTYNAIGNIITANSVTQSYSPSMVHALISDGINSYSYDTCGNMTGGAGRLIDYDFENRPLKVTKAGVVTDFTYDGDGKRVKKVVTDSSSTTTTVYIEDLYEKEALP